MSSHAATGKSWNLRYHGGPRTHWKIHTEEWKNLLYLHQGR